MSRPSKTLLTISIILLLTALPLAAQETPPEESSAKQVLSQLAEEVMAWIGALVRPQEDECPDGDETCSNEFSSTIEPGG